MATIKAPQVFLDTLRTAYTQAGNDDGIFFPDRVNMEMQTPDEYGARRLDHTGTTNGILNAGESVRFGTTASNEEIGIAIQLLFESNVIRAQVAIDLFKAIGDDDKAQVVEELLTARIQELERMAQALQEGADDQENSAQEKDKKGEDPERSIQGDIAICRAALNSTLDELLAAADSNLKPSTAV